MGLASLPLRVFLSSLNDDDDDDDDDDEEEEEEEEERREAVHPLLGRQGARWPCGRMPFAGSLWHQCRGGPDSCAEGL
eukprot:1105942-Pelagomonas_calceolata.AAC.4